MNDKKCAGEVYNAIVPLANLDSDVDFISIDDGLCLRRIEGKEIDKLVKRASGYETTLKAALLDTEFVVEKKLTSRRDFSEWTEKSQNVMNIILALRLLKPEGLYAQTAFFISSTNGLYYVTDTSPITSVLLERFFLKQEEVGGFMELWKKLQAIETEKPYLELALKQFSEFFYDVPEQLANYMMAFESLVFGRENPAPKPYGRAIGIAIGMLLGKDEKERTKIEKDLKEAYELRNRIVHGHLKIQKYHEKHTEKLFDRIADYLRRSLRKFVEE